MDAAGKKAATLDSFPGGEEFEFATAYVAIPARRAVLAHTGRLLVPKIHIDPMKLFSKFFQNLLH